MLLSIDLECITRDNQSEINKGSEENNIRDCCKADDSIDLTNDVNSNSETKCDGKMTTSTQYQHASWLLTILPSTNTGTNLLFNELPTVVRMCEKSLYLLGVIVKDSSHFRAMLHIENETWVSYDGLNSNWETIQLRNKDETLLKKVQGDGYGICAAFYYNECMKENKDTNRRVSGAAMNCNEMDCNEKDNDTEVLGNQNWHKS